MNTAGVPVMQPVQPPQMMPNGNAGAMQQPLQYVLPTVDAPTNHIAQNTFRNMPNRNLSNPTMQFGPGEVNIDQPMPGNYTIQSRFSQPQTSTSYPTVSHVSAFTAPPTNYPSVYNPSGYSQGVFPMSNQFYPVVSPQFCQSSGGVYFQTSQPPTAFLQQRMIYQQPVTTMQTTSVQATSARPKKVLKIVNPETNEVTNTGEFMQYSANEQHEGGRRSAALVDTPLRDVMPQQSSASQTLQRQVANSVFNAPSTSPPASGLPPEKIEDSVSSNLPANPVNQTENTDVEVGSEKEFEVREAPVAEKASEEEAKVGEFSSSTETSASAANTTDSGVDMAGTTNDVAIFAKENQKTAKEIEPVKENLESQLEVDTSVESKAEAATPVTEVSEAEAGTDQPDKAIPAQQADFIPEVVKVEAKAVSEPENASEPVEEKESEEAARERKRREFELKRQELLNEKEPVVDVANKKYGRSYMYLMREIIKEFALTSSCPVDISELKNLGIDIGSAPATAPSGYGSARRYEFSIKGGSFTPTWVENKNQKPKPYYGRQSDRSGHGVRQERKKSSIARLPNIDRPTQPVKLHKAEHAWKPEVTKGQKEDNDEKLFKQVRGLLNKITPSTFATLGEEFLLFKDSYNEKNINEIISIIFDKAVEEPKFCPLYSDLCKKQVVEELKESNVSEFRTGILTRCQQLFENKRQVEIDKKKKEAEEEQDEKKKKELRLEIMELEAKERRRMFGNINFIGQLYRHELIVPKILRFCIIQLLKNHSVTEGGDEESIECAVRLLETVGKLVDQQQQQNSDYQQKNECDIDSWFRHLKGLVNNVSNRIRFLILNLIDLRENKWNPRKSVDSGPMTIAAVHDEARKEEMHAKWAREQYDKTRKPYDGRASSDRRRPILVGRQSQDNRFYNKGDMRDQKSRAAGQAAHNAGTSSRKNQTLATVDQPGKLGYRKGTFNQGSSGGSGQEGRKSGLNSLRGAGRGIIASRESSEPSSREPSESRKHSVAGDRVERDKALAAAQAMTRSYMPTSASASCLTINLEGSRMGTHSDEEDHSRTNRLSEEVEKSLFLNLSEDLQEYFQVVNRGDSVNELRTALKEVIDRSSVSTAFRLMMRVGIEKIGSRETGKMQRQYLGRALCICLQEVEKKEALQGISEFCHYAVETSLWEEIPLIWEWLAEILCWSIVCDTKDVEGARPSLDDFKGAFIAADADTRKKHALLVCTLYLLAEIERSREGSVSSTAMAFEELKDLKDLPSLREALQEKKLPSGGSLYDALLN